ncbi:MAG: NTP transferase domain-containing protein, partial [Gammaproteobacteria bacterium]|nr:NTP transferase domain-containing protein [Gammaproteobacteria bacterium]
MNASTQKYSCIILAGGEGKRVDGQDKGLINYNKQPLIQHVIKQVKPQVDEII